jgi:uncharacterized LabA/DUF88 family protein
MNMETKQEIKRLAVLIDSENVPASAIGNVVLEIERFGKPVVRRAYGDFNGPQAANWERAFSRHSITPCHQFSYGRGKNSADIALVIAAMDLLYSGDVDGFCIVSSDSDFMPLAIRIREQNLDCYVFGNDHTPERVRRACTRFVALENLRFQPDNAASHPSIKPLRPTEEAVKAVKTSLGRLAGAPGDWVQLDDLERELECQASDFDPRTYGHLRLRDLLVALGSRVILDASRDGTVRVRWRLKGRKGKPAPDPVTSITDGGSPDAAPLGRDQRETG